MGELRYLIGQAIVWDLSRVPGDRLQEGGAVGDVTYRLSGPWAEGGSGSGSPTPPEAPTPPPKKNYMPNVACKWVRSGISGSSIFGWNSALMM